MDTRVTQANGTAEREAALPMAGDIPSVQRATHGADKEYDCTGFAEVLRRLREAPHVAQKVKDSAIDGRTTRHAGYGVSQRKHRRVEELFGWLKTVAWLRKARYKGEKKIASLFMLSTAAYNLARMGNLGIAASR